MANNLSKSDKVIMAQMLDTVFIPFPSTWTGQCLCLCMCVCLCLCLPTDLAVDLSRRVLGLKQKRASLSRCYVLCCPHVMCSTLKTVYKLSDRVLTAVLALSRSDGWCRRRRSVQHIYLHAAKPRCCDAPMPHANALMIDLFAGGQAMDGRRMALLLY